MIKTVKTVTEYIQYLNEKGFSFGEDALGFIHFGQNYTDAKDALVIASIELTLKIQKEFDGSFFISILEMLKKEGIETSQGAYQHLKKINLL
ncbi:DUF6123 family protein [Metabacillus herbersteinensis]|uniref:DUF6123 family protein n=1 Tax=Metabacillus herbersteinensis TaxID=283816 RepID=A0ABV6GDZ4_9BACI